MLIVSDTSPITNLLQIEQLNLLYQVFGVVILPQAVYNELSQLPKQKEFIDHRTGFLFKSLTITNWFLN